jgi:hypothetical protein
MSESENQNVTMNVEPKIESKSNKGENSTQAEMKTVNVILLNNIKSVIEITAARGTFKANELTAVGQIYDQLLKILQ